MAVPTFFIFFFLLAGCAEKAKVAYCPGEKRPQRVEAKSGANKETIALLKKHYQKWRGTPYVDGGMSASGLDCSGFTLLAYRDVFGMNLPRTAGEQAAFGQEVTREALEPGDLVFFQTGAAKRHVGIYLADDQFIHASLSRGVTISSLDDGYWHRKYLTARRLSNQISLNGSLRVASNYR
jgi:probable lipoprotein NlpC